MLLDSSPNIRVLYLKPDYISLWVCVLRGLVLKLNNEASYMLDLWLRDAISIFGKSIPVSKVVRHWGKVIQSFNVA